MSEEYFYTLGWYSGREHRLVTRASPSLDDIQRFAVVLCYGHNGEYTEVARIDTAHGFTHFDRLYRRDQPKERVEMSVWEAERHLEANWRRYARRYAGNHE
jgi:hypothetical protein